MHIRLHGLFCEDINGTETGIKSYIHELLDDGWQITLMKQEDEKDSKITVEMNNEKL